MIILPSKTGVPQIELLLNQVLMVKSFLEAIPSLHQALSSAQSPLLLKIRDLCRPDIRLPILEKIRYVIEPDVTYAKSPLDQRNQRIFAVKAGINSMLDVARQTFKELTEEVHNHLDDIRRMSCKVIPGNMLTYIGNYNIDATLKYDTTRKYWLRIKAFYFENTEPPQIFINLVRKKEHIECQTLSLVKLNLHLSDTSNEVIIRSDQLVQELMGQLRQDISHLFRVSESIALVDMIASFAQLATLAGYVRPEITGTLALKAAKHPILARVSGFRLE